MNNQREPDDSGERHQDLFVADMLFGLTAEEQAEFDAMDPKPQKNQFQALADAISLLDQSHAEAGGVKLPQSLREKIRAAAPNELPPPVAMAQRAAAPARSASFLPWAFAAACLLLAVGTFLANGPFRPSTQTDDPSGMRQQLLASAKDAIRADWTAGTTPIEGASGDVAWSTSAQRGYMRFRGLKPNDPKVEQYQLWIFDRNQPEKTPVDGGVFNVASTGEVVVPIHAALKVREPYLFAVTVEKPGGVVVSDRSRLPLLASVVP
ncbi:MAG: anti-sigma factor domain-containing protein [Chloroflexota bacterium]